MKGGTAADVVLAGPENSSDVTAWQALNSCIIIVYPHDVSVVATVDQNIPGTACPGKIRPMSSTACMF